MRNKWFLILGMLLLSLGLAWGADLINENIQSWTNHGSYGTYTQIIPAGTVSMTTCIVANGAAASGTGSKGRVQMNESTGIIELPELLSAGTATFHLAAGGTGRTVKLQSYNGSTWNDLKSFSGIGTTGATYSHVINSNSSITLRLASPSKALYVHDIIITDYAGGGSPTISVTPNTLSGFTYDVGSGPSANKTFTVSGSDLTDNISIAAPSNYQISTSAGSGFGSSLNLTQSGGTVAATTIYVRLKAGLAIGNYNTDTITASSSGAADKTVTLSGSVTTPAAPTAPVASAATAIGGTSFTANWEAVTGATGYYLDVYQKSGSGSLATDLIISEYIEGSSNNKYIEIFNGTGASVDLSGYKLDLYANGQYYTNQSIDLSGTLAHGAVKVYRNSGANLTLPSGVTADTNPAVNFNGNDAVALYKISTSSYVDIFGVIGNDPGTAWTATGGYSTLDKTLVRKSSVSSGITTNPTGTGASAFTTLATEWDVYSTDTATYLGSHTFAGSASNTYVTGFENKNVGNVTSYEVTGLDPEETYYYVVRAYDAYSQTSASSNEIEVETIKYDIPNGVDTEVATGVKILIDNGDANIITDGTIPSWPNGDFTPTFSIVLELFGAGPYDMMIETDAGWGAYYLGGSWHRLENEGGGFYLEIEASKGLMFPIILGDLDPTLPVELSAFNVILNSRNQAVLTWVSQTESGMIGYYIYRNTVEDLGAALQISDLIPATNTSQQQIYVYTDKELDGPGTYYYWLQTSDMDGSMSFHGPIYLVFEAEQNDNQGAPVITRLNSIYPNPFNPDTTISYSLANTENVEISVYNTRGQKVRTLDRAQRSTGNYRLSWNGKDDNGQQLSSGIYFIRLNAGKNSFVNKAVMMK